MMKSYTIFLSTVRPGDQYDIYPFVKYKDWTFFPNPDVVLDAEKRFKLIKEFKCRDDDILLCTPAKTGSHWVHEIVSMLISSTTEYNTQGTFLDMLMEGNRVFDKIDAIDRRRILWTHLPFSYLPTRMVENRNKIIYVNRNPKDRHVSMYTFLRGKNGFPDMSWSEYFNTCVLKDTLNSGWFNYTRDMHDAYRNNFANIFPVMYEDLHMDAKKKVTELASFLEVPYTDEFIDMIVQKCSFYELRHNKMDASTAIEPHEMNTLFRKGIIGDWKNWFTVSQNNQFDALCEEELGNTEIKFCYELQ